MNILYTGARSGIARSVIERIKMKENVTIYIAVHTEEQLKSVTSYYQKDKNITCFKIDITNPKDYKKIENLDIDVTIHNAAVGYGGSLLEIPMEKLKENYETNVFGTVSFIQYLFQKQRKGRIIIMASLAGVLPLPFLGSYCSTKSSLIMIGKVLQLETKLLEEKVDVVLIEPGLYHTGFNQVMLENKYPDMEHETYFENQLAWLRTAEGKLFLRLEKQQMDSIAKQIEKAIFSKKPKKIYRAPMSQVLAAKLYELFCW
ncbi:MAG: SDR family NAD(P)-dependent oxidoreductase [Firmicutes bacterium]|nr:SDR family NAD(P)-dependent oxidoreductase [Bacillota bacterium]